MRIANDGTLVLDPTDLRGIARLFNVEQLGPADFSKEARVAAWYACMADAPIRFEAPERNERLDYTHPMWRPEE